MEKISKEERENVLMYTSYTILYTNEMSCYWIMLLRPFIEGKDKETKKIYGALMKRVRAYFKTINKIAGDLGWFLNDYSTAMDEICDKPVEKFEKAIEWVLKCNGIPNEKYIAHVEVARSMCEVSVTALDEFMKNLDKFGIAKICLPSYRITEIDTIMHNLSNWIMRLENIQKNIDLNTKKSVIKSLDNVKRSMFDSENFYKCFEKASNLQKERKNAK